MGIVAIIGLSICLLARKPIAPAPKPTGYLDQVIGHRSYLDRTMAEMETMFDQALAELYWADMRRRQDEQ